MTVDRHRLDPHRSANTAARPARATGAASDGAAGATGSQATPPPDSGSTNTRRHPSSTPTAGPHAYATAHRTAPSPSSPHPGPRRNGRRPTPRSDPRPPSAPAPRAHGARSERGARAAAGARTPGSGSTDTRRHPSSTPTAAPARLLNRAQNRAITIESAPRSSKKWPSTDTHSTPQHLGQHLSQVPLDAGRRARHS